MKTFIAILIVILSLTGCGSIGAYTESQVDTQVSFSQYSSDTNNFLKKQAYLKVVQTGLVSGSTLLYAAQGSSSRLNMGKGGFNVTYPLWINESEVDDVEFAIDKYRHWRAAVIPRKHSTVQLINEYVSEWMNGVTFKFGLHSTEQGEQFMSVCYEFNESGTCTFTYLIDEQSVELLADDLNKFKRYSFELDS